MRDLAEPRGFEELCLGGRQRGRPATTCCRRRRTRRRSGLCRGFRFDIRRRRLSEHLALVPDEISYILNKGCSFVRDITDNEQLLQLILLAVVDIFSIEAHEAKNNCGPRPYRGSGWGCEVGRAPRNHRSRTARTTRATFNEKQEPRAGCPLPEIGRGRVSVNQHKRTHTPGLWIRFCSARVRNPIGRSGRVFQ